MTLRNPLPINRTVSHIVGDARYGAGECPRRQRGRTVNPANRLLSLNAASENLAKFSQEVSLHFRMRAHHFPSLLFCSYCSSNDFPQCPRIARAKALAGGFVPSLWVDPLQVNVMTGLSPQHEKKSALRAAIAFTKGMNGIQLGNVRRRERRELIRLEAAQAISARISSKRLLSSCSM